MKGVNRINRLIFLYDWLYKKMDFEYERKINYYETDKMGVVHH